MSRTGTLGRLYGHDSDPVVEMNPQDMGRLQLTPGQRVRVSSRRGAVVLPVRASDSLARNQLFIAMHWGEEALTGRDSSGRIGTGVNALTSPALCPQSRQPELKHAGVRVEKVELPWQLTAMSWFPAERALALREHIRPMLRLFETASLVPFGREPDPQGRLGLLMRAACAAPPDGAVLAPLRAAFALDETGLLGYSDPRRGQQRALRLEADGSGGQRLSGFWLAGDASGESWLRALLESGGTLPGPARSLLAPGALIGKEATPRSVQVCACFDVSEATICSALRAMPGSTDERVGALGAALKCGTNCGSCIPALKSLAKSQPAPCITE